MFGFALTCSGNRTLAAIPGSTIRKTGRIFRYPANTVAALVWSKSFEASAL